MWSRLAGQAEALALSCRFTQALTESWICFKLPLMCLQGDVRGPAGLTPLHLAALVQDHGACARSLARADACMSQSWVTLQTADGKTPQDFARLAGTIDWLVTTSSRQTSQGAELCRSSDSNAHQQAVQCSQTVQAAALPCSDTAPVRSPSGHKRQKMAISPDSETRGVEWDTESRTESSGHSSQGFERCSRHLTGQSGHSKAASRALSSRMFSDAHMPWESDSLSLAPSLQLHAHRAADFRELQKDAWQLSMESHATADPEAWDASSSEDESLAATHLELPCSDSEQSPLHAAFASED